MLTDGSIQVYDRSNYGTGQDELRVEYFSERRHTKDQKQIENFNHSRNQIRKSKEELSNSSKMDQVYEREINCINLPERLSQRSQPPNSDLFGSQAFKDSDMLLLTSKNLIRDQNSGTVTNRLQTEQILEDHLEYQSNDSQNIATEKKITERQILINSHEINREAPWESQTSDEYEYHNSGKSDGSKIMEDDQASYRLIEEA